MIQAKNDSNLTGSTEKANLMERLIQLTYRGIDKAQEESRRMGVPNVYSINGKLYYEMPNGEIKLAQDENGKLIDP